jgi:ketosteroid isomerase-like protein
MSQENVEVVRGTRTSLTPLNERASQRRSLDERLFIRFPALFRLLAGAWMRLPVRSRLRRSMVARRVQLGNAAASRRDLDSVSVGWDPSIEYRPRGDLIPPDEDPVVYGHDGYRRLWRKWLDSFGDLRFEPEEVIDLGDKLLVTMQVRGRGSGSGVPVSLPMVQLFTLRRGLVVRHEDFADRSEALEAAGLRE